MRTTTLVLALILGAASILSGCATPLSPELQKKAEAVKGQKFEATESVYQEEVGPKCDNGTDDARACSRGLLQLAVQKQAYDKCVRYRIRNYRYWDSTFVGYVRGFHPVHFSGQATATVTCLGADD